MYKKQMLFQKIACMLALIAAALVFVYSLGMSTDLYDALARTILYPDYNLEQTSVAGSRVYYDMFSFNRTFTRVSIGLILVTLVLFITNTNVRRKYYIGNYVSAGLFSVAALGVTIWSVPQIMDYKSKFQNNVDFEALKAFSKDWGTLYIGPNDTFWFDISFAVFGFLIFTVVLLVLNVILKILVMKAEQNAIGKGRGV
ncbi:hypothetical protein [Ruminococcus albus]|uniref:Conserved domain protein n=1 Tax=Ruminococcus albus 8 TaxID=246199 RepID=E9SDJ2_RUMAL|nr:hypothetical protein [Ruminococcus albus]EGC02661.1 conserved domain protein [Ruminococcus albus 8]MCC3350121.1 hypothetical protein [Ruminococcus albus 8]